MNNKKASEQTLNLLHNAIAKDLLKRISEGEAPAAVLNAAIKFLQDNNIEADIDTSPNLKELKEKLPVFEEFMEVMSERN